VVWEHCVDGMRGFYLEGGFADGKGAGGGGWGVGLVGCGKRRADGLGRPSLQDWPLRVWVIRVVDRGFGLEGGLIDSGQDCVYFWAHGRQRAHRVGGGGVSC